MEPLETLSPLGSLCSLLMGGFLLLLFAFKILLLQNLHLHLLPKMVVLVDLALRSIRVVPQVGLRILSVSVELDRFGNVVDLRFLPWSLSLPACQVHF